MKKTHYIVPFLIGLALAVGIFIGGKLQFGMTDSLISSDRTSSNNLNKAKLNKLIDYIEYEYVDDVNTDSIVDLTVNQILDRLDPHSMYISKENLKKVNESMYGKFVGVGISFYIHNDSLAVIKTIQGSDARAKGIRFGDRIIIADNDTLTNKKLSSEDVKNKLRGIEDSKVKLTIYRKSNDSLFEVNITRKQIPIRSVDSYYKVNDTIGYIKINRFAQTTQEEFENALDDLKSEGINELILDLRDNPGGYLNVGIQIADEFLHNNNLIVFTKNKNGDIEHTYATEKGDFQDQPIFVLVNESTASAAEIVAGALQDNDQGTIVGRRTYGKGLVQSEMPLPDGSAIRLTTSRYYTPTGRSIQRPYKLGEKEEYEDNYYERFTNGELISVDSIQVNDSLKFTTPKGKVVYGGGGIIPDVFIPQNNPKKYYWLRELLGSALTSYFVFEYMDKNPHDLPKISKEAFFSDYKVSDKMLNEFYLFLDRDGFTIEKPKYNDITKKYLKAEIGEILFDTNIAAKIRNKGDEFIEKCVESAPKK